MAGFNYTKMQATANRLLERFNQGAVTIGRVVVTPAAGPYDVPTTSIVQAPINAVVRGVSSQYVDGQEVLATDLMIIADVGAYEPAVSDVINVDGRPVVVIRRIKIPASGVTVTNKFIVRA